MNDAAPRVSDETLARVIAEPGGAGPHCVERIALNLRDARARIKALEAERDKAREERDQFLEQIKILRDGPLYRDFQKCAADLNRVEAILVGAIEALPQVREDEEVVGQLTEHIKDLVARADRAEAALARAGEEDIQDRLRAWFAAHGWDCETEEGVASTYPDVQVDLRSLAALAARKPEAKSEVTGG